MADNNKEYTDRSWQSKQTHWNKVYEHVLHSDRITADIGIFILKAIMFISCGGIVALLAAFPFVKTNADGAAGIVTAGKFLLIAIISGVLAVVSAYFRQGNITAVLWDNMKEEGSEPEYPSALLRSRILMAVTILLLIVSLMAFSYGAITALEAISISIPPIMEFIPPAFEEYM